MLDLKRIKIAADGGQFPADYAGTDHVAVLFPDHGVMIAVESIGSPKDPNKGMPQADCEEACKSLSLAGFTDWDSATEQAALLVRDTRFSNPAVDPNYFPRIKANWHWTRTDLAGDPAYAWGVDLSNGYVGASNRGDLGFGLAVRRVGQ